MGSLIHSLERASHEADRSRTKICLALRADLLEILTHKGKTMTFYVVTSGEYSNYHIDGVFTKKHLAEQYIQMFEDSDSSPYEIEEWKDNHLHITRGDKRKPYLIHMAYNGEVTDISVRGDPPIQGVNDYGDIMVSLKGILSNHCMALNEQHAIKITNELRTRLIAENKWKGKVG